MPTVHLLIRGQVQGVFFRASAKDKAEELGVTGWVKNTYEGDVELMATGNAEQLKKFTDWCRQGPSKAVVTELQVKEIEEQSFGRFRVRSSA